VVFESLTIAHVLLSFGVGGQERVVLDLVGLQRKLGWQVYAVALTSPMAEDLGGQLAERGAVVERVVKGGGFDARLYWRLALLFRRRGVQLVHTHNPSPLIYAAPAGKAARARVVHTKHGEHRDSKRRMALRRAASRCVDAFVAVSETTASFAREQRECAPDKLRVIQNGTDLSRFLQNRGGRARIRAELGISERAFVAGSLGRFVPEKNQAALLAAAAPLLGEEFQLVLAGDGPDLEPFRRLLEREPRRGFVHVLGRRPDVPDLLAACDAFVISSRTEGLPIGLIEAMGSGLAIVSTAVGGIPQVVRQGETGTLVPPGDERALRAAMADLAAHPDRARALGDRARARALAEFTMERMHRDYLSVYEQVLK
jgi:glycosyltransferase involved in cell wall biosynthesis